MLSLLIILVVTGIFFVFQNKPLILFLFTPLFFYFLAYDLRDSDFSKKLFIFVNNLNYENYLFYGFAIFVSVLIIIIYDNFNRKSINNPTVNYNLEKLIRLYYILAFISLFATIVNLSHVNFSFSLLLVSPREYELLFGKSTFSNYLYFLNIPSLCIYIYVTQTRNIRIKYSTIINTLLVLISLFHGVKFTFFDTILIPLLFYNYISTRGLDFKKIAIILLFLSLFYYLFSTYIRGGESGFVNQLLSYILPNYYNLAYSIEKEPLQWDGLNSLMPDKFPTFFTYFYKYGPEGFVLNEKYNMQTAYISYYRLAWMFGPFIFLGVISLLRRNLLNNSNKNLLEVFLLSLIDYCLLFTFFFNAFIKTKYIFYIIIIFIIHKVFYFTNNKKLLQQ